MYMLFNAIPVFWRLDIFFLGRVSQVLLVKSRSRLMCILIDSKCSFSDPKDSSKSIIQTFPDPAVGVPCWNSPWWNLESRRFRSHQQWLHWRRTRMFFRFWKVRQMQMLHFFLCLCYYHLLPLFLYILVVWFVILLSGSQRMALGNG